MDLRDYLRMIARGWLLLMLVVVATVAAACGYLLVAPKQYSATASVLVTVNDPKSVGDAQLGALSANTLAPTYAGVITSPIVMEPVAKTISPRLDTADALNMVSAIPRASAAIIDVTAHSPDPRLAAQLVNGAVKQAVSVIPMIQGTSVSDTPVSLQPIQLASQPTAPESPNARQVLALALVVGIVLGLATTITAQTLDTRLRRPEDVARAGVPLLAVLPRLPRAQRHGVVVSDHPTSPAVEAYRSLRTNLSRLEEASRRSLLVAPVIADRELSVVAANVAWSFGQSGRSVLVVDVDLHNGSVADLLGLAPVPGLSDLLATAQTADLSVVQHTRNALVDAITAGTPNVSASDLISLPRFESLLRSWENSYDLVVLAAPPVLQYTDAAIVARQVGATVLAVAARRTRAQFLLTALATLRNAQVEPLGVIAASVRGGSARSNRKIRGGGISSVLLRSEGPTSSTPSSRPHQQSAHRR